MERPIKDYAKKTFGLEFCHLENIVPAAERLSPEGMQQLAEELGSFWQRLRRSQCPQFVLGLGDRIDSKRTMRGFLRHGGALAKVHYQEKLRQKRLVVLIDCSASALIRPGLFVLIAAILRVDPKIVVLGFDFEVFSLQPNSLQGLQNYLYGRVRIVEQKKTRYLDLMDLDLLLRLSSRFAPSFTQCYLLIISDLFIHHEMTLEKEAIDIIRKGLMTFRKVWLVDMWPIGPPLTEAADGTVTCSARGLKELIEGQKGTFRDGISFIQTETGLTFYMPLSVLSRLDIIGDEIVLEGRRFTPVLHQIGFVQGEEATPASRLIYIPRNSSQVFGDIFRATQPL